MATNQIKRRVLMSVVVAQLISKSWINSAICFRFVQLTSPSNEPDRRERHLHAIVFRFLSNSHFRFTTLFPLMNHGLRLQT